MPSSDQEASVVHCVNEVLLEHDNWPPVNNDANLADDYGYEQQSLTLFLKSVRKKLATAGYTFTFDEAFVVEALEGTVADLKVAVDGATEAA